MRIIKWFLLSIVALAALWFGLVLSHWLPRPTAQEQAALAALKQAKSQSLGEHNAYAYLWLFDYDIPDDQIDAVMATDLAAIEQYPADQVMDPPFRSSADGRYPALPPIDAGELSCARDAPACLATVSNDLAFAKTFVAEHQRRLQKEASLAGYDHIKTLTQPRLEVQVSSYRPSTAVVLAAAAVEHLEGRSELAVARLCGYAGTWRRLRANADSLVLDVTGQAAISSSAGMLAQILAQRPDLDDTLCLSSFAPLSDDELNQCSTMAGEFRLFNGPALLAVPADASWPDRIQPHMLNQRHMRGLFALPLGYYCQDEHAQRVAARTHIPAPPKTGCSLIGKVFSPYACILGAIASPSYESYYRRLLDVDARLRLLNAARWVRAQGTNQTPTKLMLSLPERYRSDIHPISFDADSGELVVSQLVRRPEADWRIPLKRSGPQIETQSSVGVTDE